MNNKLAITFDSIVNTDISLIKKVIKDFNVILADKYPKIDFENVISRYNPNPLSIIAHKDIKPEKLEDILNLIIESEYDNIINMEDTIIFNEIIDYLKIIKSIENISITIICKNDIEYQYAIKNLPNEFTYIIDDISKRLDFDIYIIKVFDHIIFDNLKKKKIICPNYNFNSILSQMYITYKGNNIENDISILEIFIFKTKG